MPPECVDHQPRFVERVDAAVDRSEVLRYLGYPVGRVPEQGLRAKLDAWVDQAAAVATPRAAYVVLSVVDLDRHSLTLHTPSGATKFTGAIGEFLGPSQLVAAFVATAGGAVEQFASQLLSEGDDLAAMVANAVGAERAEAAETAVLEELRRSFGKSGLATTLPYSPGYCGMALTEQVKLFALFGGEAAGVTLTEQCLMRPLKSVSGLIGLGPADQVQSHGSPCDRCELYNCAMRR